MHLSTFTITYLLFYNRYHVIALSLRYDILLYNSDLLKHTSILLPKFSWKCKEICDYYWLEVNKTTAYWQDTQTMFRVVNLEVRVFYCTYKCIKHLPEGNLRDDQISWEPQSALIGGELITGQDVLPDNTGPKPLLLPATAINTVGTPPPVISVINVGV